jgi:chemotaxis protein histidine kinase CheA
LSPVYPKDTEQSSGPEAAKPGASPILTAEYCELLNDVWARVPIIWRAASAVLLEVVSFFRFGGVVNQIFRAVHTLKGNAGMAGVAGFVDFAHRSKRSWRVTLRTAASRSELEGVFLFIEDPSGISIRELASGSAKAAEAVVPSHTKEQQPGRPSVRADVEELDRLVNLAGELAIAVAGLKLELVTVAERLGLKRHLAPP